MVRAGESAPEGGGQRAFVAFGGLQAAGPDGSLSPAVLSRGRTEPQSMRASPGAAKRPSARPVSPWVVLDGLRRGQ